MSHLLEKMKKYGVDLEETMPRFVDDEELYESCLDLFLAEEGFERLGEQLAGKAYGNAFDTAHTLKGVAANLGLKPLFDQICVVVEALRAEDYSNIEAQYAGMMQAWKTFTEMYKEKA